ncbi:zf-HC2 domain-containing protein [Kocuria sp. CPCC 205292]|uniref:zf-HC2 domain-containing protein n=1 Tax=Kocuria cellulosilytica TaxID=3071451 RepID=UPI0034D678A0
MTRTTEPLAQGRTPRTDEELLAAVRAQRPDAFPDLRDRHWHTAVVVARLHTPSRQDAEQLAGTAFDQVLAELDEGAGGEDGPGVFLRARLVAVVGRAGAEQEHAAESVTGVYLGLPASWQAVLWHLEIEALELERTAAVLGLSPAATTALHLEARAGLRAAYRQARQDLPALPGCADCAADLGAFADGGLPAERAQAVRSHLDECPRCTADHLYLQDTEAGLRGWLLPVLAGVPLWDTRTDELVELIRTAGRMSAGRLGAAPGTDVAGGALAAVHVSRRGRKVLLGAGALAAAAALAGVAATGSGGLGDGTTQAAGDTGGAGGTASSAPATTSGADDGAAAAARAPGAAVPGRAGTMLSLPTAEPSPGPLTEAAAEARTARASSGTIITAAAAEGPAAEGAEDGARFGTQAEPRTPRSAPDDDRAPRSATPGAERPEAGSPGTASPDGGGTSAAGGGAGAPVPPADAGDTPTGDPPEEQPPAPGTPAPEEPAAETPAPEPAVPGTPAPEDPVTEAPAPVDPATGAPAPADPATGAPAPADPVSEAPASVAPAPVAPATGAPAPGTPVPEAPGSEAPAAPATGAPAAGAPAPGTTTPATGATGAADPAPGS